MSSLAPKLFGVGTGPGDPELLTLKAVRVIEGAEVIAHFRKRGRPGHARAIVARHWPERALELPLDYPVTTEIATAEADYKGAIGGFFDAAAAAVAAHLDAGRSVAVLSEGDPFFYGSYMHLHLRLAPRYPTEIVAGVTSMSGCWSEAGLPLAQGEDVLTILPGTLPAATLAARLAQSDAAVILKVGRHLAKIRQALAEAGKLDRALYVERGTMADARIVPMAARDDAPAPYFSQVLVPGWAGRP